MKPIIILQILFTQNPTDTVEEVKEYTEEQIFYNLENPSHDDYERYYTSLERKLKSKNDELKTLLGTMQMLDPELGTYIRKIQRIINL